MIDERDCTRLRRRRRRRTRRTADARRRNEFPKFKFKYPLFFVLFCFAFFYFNYRAVITILPTVVVVVVARAKQLRQQSTVRRVTAVVLNMLHYYNTATRTPLCVYTFFSFDGPQFTTLFFSFKGVHCSLPKIQKIGPNLPNPHVKAKLFTTKNNLKTLLYLKT